MPKGLGSKPISSLGDDARPNGISRADTNWFKTPLNLLQAEDLKKTWILLATNN